MRFNILLTFSVFACSGPTPDNSIASDDLKKVQSTQEQHRKYVAEAAIFIGPAATQTPKEILQGPQGKGSFRHNEEVTCDFVEPNSEDKLGGMTPKFQCRLADGDIDKVKYGLGRAYDEVYSETLSSRLMWMIGMPADRVYPVRVTCRNCPQEPWAAYVQAYGQGLFNKARFSHPGPRATRRFEVAAIERKFDAAKIEGPNGDDGVRWDELPAWPSSYWTMSRADRAALEKTRPEAVNADAARLFAAWTKHADNKGDNQRLMCAKDGVTENGECKKPLFVIHDMGISFGGGTELGGLKYESVDKASLPGWTNQAKSPTWKDFSKCQASLTSSAWSGTLDDPRVSNAGRALIAARLAALSDAQLQALFTAVRIDEKKEMWIDPRSGEKRVVTAADWVTMFKWMVDIINKPCPEKA